MNATRTASDALLTIDGLRVEFLADGRPVQAVRGVRLHIHKGEFLAMVGRSGSGKSVTLYSILGLVNDPPGIVDGSIRFDGADLLPPMDRYVKNGSAGVRKRIGPFLRAHRRLLTEVRGRDIGLILQDPYGALIPHCTVGRQLLDNFRINRPEWSALDNRGIGLEWLRRVGFDDPLRVWDRYPGELSGGMAQRAMIAIALSTEPRLLLADEPTSALDGSVQLEILDLLLHLSQEEQVAVLLVTHDIGVALRYAGRLSVVHAGEVVEEGSAERFVSANGDLHPAAVELLRGYADVHRNVADSFTLRVP